MANKEEQIFQIMKECAEQQGQPWGKKEQTAMRLLVHALVKIFNILMKGDK